jgi:hypothetical protein
VTFVQDQAKQEAKRRHEWDRANGLTWEHTLSGAKNLEAMFQDRIAAKERIADSQRGVDFWKAVTVELEAIRAAQS